MGSPRKNNSRSRKELNKKAMDERVKYRAELTPTEQLERLNRRLGAGIGAARERLRLVALAGVLNGKAKTDAKFASGK